ncbi:hypothetical protein CAEBREN_05505 [Caenorhabditis brenneri]|uniref:BTB domain-containing protein n=1 Tax=Caenorhabditis brenneri TaxID=135651 RepID=G0PKC4_CAEBE|nr:hypothetical protein CAEBREN_05505 [Caenorhabditis brenneri]
MHSGYFKNMFSRRVVGSNQKEIVLLDTEDPMAFRKFLELIYGVQCLTDENIDGVSFLADMLRAKIAQDRCIDFLNEKSLMSAREKFEIAGKCDFMKELKADIISNIRTPEELQDLVPDISQLDKETSNMILKKSLELHGAPPAQALNNPPAYPQFNYPADYYFEAYPILPQPEFFYYFAPEWGLDY